MPTGLRALLAHYLLPQAPRVALLGALLLASTALQLASPQIIRHFIDAALGGAALGGLVLTALLFLAVAASQQLAGLGTTYLGESIGWTSTNRLRGDLAAHCLGLDLSFHKDHTPGEMIERVDGDVTTLSNFFSAFVVQMVGNGLLLVGVLLLLAREDWRTALAFTVFVVFSLLILGRVRGIAVPHWAAAREAAANLFSFLEERLAGTEDIRANGATGYVMRCFFGLIRERLRRERKAAVLGSVMAAVMFAVFTVGYAIAFVAGWRLYTAGLATIGTVYLLFHYMEMLNRPVVLITFQLEDLQKAGAGARRLQELARIHTRIEDGPGERLPDGPLEVEYKAVTFGYRPEEPVLKDVTLRMEPGEVLGVLGRTGSGKTTLTRLLFRLYDPDQGTVRLGGTDVRQPRLAELRRRVAMVTQDVQLFQASVRDNLTFFDPEVPDARIREALEALGLGEWVRSLPAGLDTELDSGGGGLSAGEAQLLAFARVFLRDPGVVILDEASSRLDPATERRIEAAVDRLLENRTGIIIAHRLGTVRRADRILILEEGRIAEQGPRAELAADPSSRFSALLRTGDLAPASLPAAGLGEALA
jgi:ATP-binding cassette subfamily B protein